VCTCAHVCVCVCWDVCSILLTILILPEICTLLSYMYTRVGLYDITGGINGACSPNANRIVVYVHIIHVVSETTLFA
jgi:hypothetical protein